MQALISILRLSEKVSWAVYSVKRFKRDNMDLVRLREFLKGLSIWCRPGEKGII